MGADDVMQDPDEAAKPTRLQAGLQAGLLRDLDGLERDRREAMTHDEAKAAEARARNAQAKTELQALQSSRSQAVREEAEAAAVERADHAARLKAERLARDEAGGAADAAPSSNEADR